jgi:hypothetical protein
LQDTEIRDKYDINVIICHLSWERKKMMMILGQKNKPQNKRFVLKRKKTWQAVVSNFKSITSFELKSLAPLRV